MAIDNPTKPSQEIQFRQLLEEAVTKPGMLMQAYSRFWRYSLGNQLLALMQCYQRGIQPGALATYPKWKELGRYVRKGEKAVVLCQPVTRKRIEKDKATGEQIEHTWQSFTYRANWFVISQTEGQAVEPEPIPAWDKGRALAALSIEEVAFEHLDGNVQGLSRDRQISINPIAQLPHKTLFHELAHVLLGHTAENAVHDGELTPRSAREMEAECVALLCCEALGLEGATYARAYIQGWWGAGNPVPEKSAMKIMACADKVLKAGYERQTGGAE